MKLKFAAISVLVASMLAPMAGAYAQDVDRSHPVNFVKDSAITSLIKTKLAAEKMSTLKNIKVDTDDQGVVWLGGYTRTKEMADRAESIARNTDGVRSVKNQITVRADQ